MNEFLYQGCIIYGKGITKNKKLWKDIITSINFSVYMGRADIKTASGLPESLRPTELNLIKKGNKEVLSDIRILFVFSHNNSIKSYFYSRDDWIHILRPKLSLKFLKQHRNLKREDFIEGIRIFYVDSIDEIDEGFRRKIEKCSELNEPICILCKDNKTFDRLIFFADSVELERDFIVQDTWV
jgi:hypothetical protein